MDFQFDIEDDDILENGNMDIVGIYVMIDGVMTLLKEGYLVRTEYGHRGLCTRITGPMESGKRAVHLNTFDGPIVVDKNTIVEIIP